MLARHILRLFAIFFIILVSTIAWLILSVVIDVRTQTAGGKLGGAVADLWGEPQAQPEPSILQTWKETRTEADPNDATKTREVECTRSESLGLKSSRIDVALHLDYRRKGLLWYSTYRAKVSGRYEFGNEGWPEGTARFVFYLPSAHAVFDDFTMSVDGREVESFSPVDEEGRAAFEVRIPSSPGEAHTVEYRYATQGLDEWRYQFLGGGNRVRDFELSVRTDFDAVDFPAKTMSPTEKKPAGDGWTLTWKYGSLMGGRDIAVAMPHLLNPGPLAARISRFAPVSLIFFLGVLFFLYLLRGIPLHPIHYAFLAASFFAFHLLFSYLVDHLHLFLSFGIASAVSVILVVSYLRVVVSPRFAFFQAGALQVLYLVLFSFAHFFEGWTGLIVTIGAIVTLFVVMQSTARVNWEQVFPGRTRPAPAA